MTNSSNIKKPEGPSLSIQAIIEKIENVSYRYMDIPENFFEKIVQCEHEMKQFLFGNNLFGYHSFLDVRRNTVLLTKMYNLDKVWLMKSFSDEDIERMICTVTNEMMNMMDKIKGELVGGFHSFEEDYEDEYLRKLFETNGKEILLIKEPVFQLYKKLMIEYVADISNELLRAEDLNAIEKKMSSSLIQKCIELNRHCPYIKEVLNNDFLYATIRKFLQLPTIEEKEKSTLYQQLGIPILSLYPPLIYSELLRNGKLLIPLLTKEEFVIIEQYVTEFALSVFEQANEKKEKTKFIIDALALLKDTNDFLEEYKRKQLQDIL